MQTKVFIAICNFFFCRKRDDTDKAIYRLCCIGLVEDVTIDYLSQTYELKIRNRSDEDFQKCMFDFFRKYFSKEQAEKRVAEIEEQKGRNFLDKCLGYLTQFVYSNLEKKRYRAIDDMRIACEDSISERERTGNDDWLKEFIHLYFNSKYARKGYMVGGKDFSLTEDTDEQGLDGFDVVSKYLRAMTEAVRVVKSITLSTSMVPHCSASEHILKMRRCNSCSPIASHSSVLAPMRH